MNGAADPETETAAFENSRYSEICALLGYYAA